ncbi:TetR/AcrR family transcriptional regulator [Streptococcus sanguinis]|uniref:TetR/AcrR family transcriptional regulator n=1 Tax=Streptococcus sanguinis TaxID=1305 RepID=UPI0022850F07|nr:TetR/AcrR family transcriptional regulator [Streptococcus sanguinis]MCY7012205.1 TetR/AcrR family transcriptional regulator [Streptococcus sanguinis]
MANKKDFILDTAQKLFMEQGFDQTSISQILEATQIARGTLYYYFSSKEEIMDAIIERTIEQAFTASQAFADNRELTIIERLAGSIAALNLNHQEGEEVLLHLNQPQNALLHEKTNQILLERAPQILLPIIQDGIAAGDMKTDYPYESLEMILTYSLQAFGSSFQALPPEKQQQKLQAFLYLLETLFHSRQGYFNPFLSLIQTQSS